MAEVIKGEIEDAGTILAMIKESRGLVINTMATRVMGGTEGEPGDRELALALTQLSEIKQTLETFVLKAKELKHAKTYR